MLAAVRDFAGSRWRIFAVFASLALGKACASGPLPKPTTEGLAASMARATGARVEESGLAWEASRGWLADLLVGRNLLFIGQRSGEPRDVYRAQVRVTPEGQVLRPRRVANLTATSAADETGLVTVGHRATFSTIAEGAVAAVSLLEASGSTESTPALLGAVFDEAELTKLRRVHFALSARRAEVTLDEKGLSIDVGSGRSPRFVFETQSYEDRASDAPEHWVQPASVDETSLAERLRRWLGLTEGQQSTVREEPSSEARLADDEPVSEAPTADDAQPPETAPSWPPQPVAALAPGGAPARWQAVDEDTPDEPASLYQTELQLSVDEHHVAVLIAIDLRRLELRFDGGHTRPKSPLGPPGKGRVASELLPRVVATFNGTGADAGAMTDGRMLVPPEASRATVAMMESGALGFGPWPGGDRPSGLVALRQSGAPLVLDGKAQPQKSSSRWGAQSALCRRKDGYVLYAWSERSTPSALARALVAASCDFAMALGAGDEATGFGVSGQSGSGSGLRPIRAAMRPPNPADSADDYFYVLRREPIPDDSDVEWTASLGTQPEPRFAPALLAGRARVGNLELELFTVRPGRVEWRLVAGAAEPLIEGRPAPRRELEADERERVLFALDVGHTTRPTRYGLAFGARQSLPLRSIYPTLVLPRQGDVELLAAGEVLEPSDAADYVQLPALIVDGQLTRRAAQTGARRRRGALCVLPGGRVLVAFVEHDTSAPLAIYLRSAGCESAFELDRASQHRALLYRQGTPLAPASGAATTQIVGLARPMILNTFSFRHDSRELGR